MHLKVKSDKSRYFNYDDPETFKLLFHEYYRPLTVFASTYVREMEASKDIVQDFFLKLWEKRKEIEIKCDVKSYLYQSVKNTCINYIKSNGRIYVSLEETGFHDIEEGLIEKIITIETEERIFKAIEDLPPQCRTIFKLSRLEKLKYSEIAKKLGLSIKTIENQISTALKKLSKIKHILFLFTVYFI
jgi:RNA polymerase sigma-70 factor, ECF subfamily